MLIYIYVVHISKTQFLVCLYESSCLGWMFEDCSFDLHFVSLLMSCCLFVSPLLHSLLILLNILLHPLVPSCFLLVLLLCSPLSLPDSWSEALSPSLSVAAPHLASETFPPMPQRGRLSHGHGWTGGRGRGGT